MKIFIATSCVFALLACSFPAAADESDPAAALAAPLPGTIVSDARLATLRGKYVPSENSAAGLAGAVVYFGLDMTTKWTTSGPGGNAYAANMHVSFDLSNPQVPKVDIVTTSSQRAAPTSTLDANPAIPNTPGTIDGAAGSGASGFLQAIQIAGNGNAVSNGASIAVSSVTPSFVVTDPITGGTPCSACTFSTSPANLGVTIALPGGNAASQTLGASGLAQTAQVTSDANSVVNQLHLALGLRPGSNTSFLPSITAGLLAPIPMAGVR